MADKRNIAIVALLIAVGGLAVYQFVGRESFKQLPAADASMLANMHLSKDGKDARSGGRSSYEVNQVRNTITKNNPKIKECYEKFLATAPQVTDGKVLVDWQIGSVGDVVQADIVTSDIGSDILHACLTESIKSWTFPPTHVEAPVYTSFTFVFKKD